MSNANKLKEVANLERAHTLREGDVTKWVYCVKSLRNRLRPTVGSYVTEAEVVELIDAGVEVNVSLPK